MDSSEGQTKRRTPDYFIPLNARRDQMLRSFNTTEKKDGLKLHPVVWIAGVGPKQTQQQQKRQLETPQTSHMKLCK